LREAAAKLAERVRKGEAFATVAAEVGGTVETTLPVTRNTTPQGLTKAAIAQAFALPLDGVGNAETPDNQSRTVFQVTKITPASDATKAQAEAIAKELSTELQNDVITSYVSALQKDLGVSVDRKMFERLTGAGQQ